MNPSRLTTKMNRKSVATYGNQRPIAFVRQSLLGDLRLRDLVDLLAEGLPRVRLDLHAPAHEEDPERHRQHRAEHQVDDGLRDRQVERADVDRDPLVLLELVGRVELAAGERARRREQGERREEEERAPHSGSFPKYETSDRTSSIV